jgi:heme-degrading monooxygenase HmoA
MFAVIFEVRPHAARWDDYLGIAAMLRPELALIEGFVENTRFRSDARDGVLLSLSLWRDEKALIRWRTHAGHFAAQGRGRAEILAQYRLRVGAVGAARTDETETGDARAMLIAEGDAAACPGAITRERFTALLDPARIVTMAGFATFAEASSAAPSGILVSVIRDYGMMDRREAPQFHPPV